MESKLTDLPPYEHTIIIKKPHMTSVGSNIILMHRHKLRYKNMLSPFLSQIIMKLYQITVIHRQGVEIRSTTRVYCNIRNKLTEWDSPSCNEAIKVLDGVYIEKVHKIYSCSKIWNIEIDVDKDLEN